MYGSPYWSHASINREDSAYSYIYIGVARTIKWIDEYYILAVRTVLGRGNGDEELIFFGSNATYYIALGKGTDKEVVSENV